jgi:hypothetical protein
MRIQTSLVLVGVIAAVGCRHSKEAEKPTAEPKPPVVYKTPAAGNGIVIVFRNVGGFMGGAAMQNNSIYVDGKPVGDIAHDTFASLEMKPGDHMITVKGAASSESNLSVKVVDGQLVFVKVDNTAMNTPALKASTPEVGKQEIQTDCRAGLETTIQ